MDTNPNQQPQSPQPTVEQTPIPPKPSANSKTVLIAVVVFIVIMIGLITYILAARTKPVSQPPTLSPTLSQPSPTPVDETANWKTYRNEKYSYQVDYPKNWEAIEARVKIGNEYLTPQTSLNPENNELQKVIFLDNETYAQWWFEVKVLSNPKQLTFESLLPNQAPEGFIAKDKGNILLGGIQAKKYAIGDVSYPPDLKIVTIYKEGIYIITFSGVDPDAKIVDYQRYNQILSTFRFD